jgi:hypothetical protein
MGIVALWVHEDKPARKKGNSRLSTGRALYVGV